MEKELTVQGISERIIVVRDKEVLLASDVAEFYSYDIRNFNTTLKGYVNEFKSLDDRYMFELTRKEVRYLYENFPRLQNLKYNPNSVRVFTERGVLLTASILRNKRAFEVSKLLVEGFIMMREHLNKKGGQLEMILERIDNISQRLDRVENRVENKLLKHDSMIEMLCELVNDLMDEKEKKPIGFIPKNTQSLD